LDVSGTSGQRYLRSFRTAEQLTDDRVFTNTLVATIVPKDPVSSKAIEADKRQLRFHFGLLQDAAVLATGKTTASDLERPVEIKLDQIAAAQVSRDQTARQHSGDKACTLAINALNTQTRERVSLRLTLPGPIGVKDYPIMDHGSFSASQDNPGEVDADFAVKDADMSLLEFRGVGGVFRISSITPAGLLTGMARIEGYRCTDCRYDRRLSGPSRMSVEASIEATVQDPLRLINAILQDDGSADSVTAPGGSDCLTSNN
jgi:hypothetical protein